jgi:hypothetical protein
MLAWYPLDWKTTRVLLNQSAINVDVIVITRSGANQTIYIKPCMYELEDILSITVGSWKTDIIQVQ